MKEDEASDTACRVLQGLVYSATRQSTAHLVSEDAKDTAMRFMSRFPLGQKRLRGLKGIKRGLIPLQESLLLPGISLHYALRKRWIEERTRGAIQDGARLVVNLGAGMDSLALRLSKEFSHVHFIEIDHPASQSTKELLLKGESHRENFELLPVDFSKETLADRLPEARLFDSNAPAVAICEGVLAYLKEDDVRTLLRSVRDLFSSGARFIFTYLAYESPTGRKPFGPLLRLYLHKVSESLHFQISPEDLSDFLQSERFQLTETAIGPDLLEQYGAKDYKGPIHDLEILAEAVAKT